MSHDGKYFEKLVHLIERSLDPNAKVELDVNMPILTSNEGHTTQCDIVISKGTAARKTITIIEVQDRGSRVKPNDFRGWQRKLEDVGAQHLICISRQPFPASIKEKVKQSGSQIYLMNLVALDVHEIPMEFFGYKFQLTDLQILNADIKKVAIKKGQISEAGMRKILGAGLNTNDKKFTYDKLNFLSIKELLKLTIDQSVINKETVINFESYLHQRNPLYIKNGKKFIALGIKLRFVYVFSMRDIPVSMMSYEQDEFGTLAWVLIANYDMTDIDVEVRLPVIRTESGYEIRHIEFNSSQTTPINFSFEVIKDGKSKMDE